MKIPRLPLLPALIGLALAALPGLAVANLPARIDFGSCLQQDMPQPIWEAIIARKPDVFVLAGDNVYGDTDDMGLLRQSYEKLAAQSGFQRLRKLAPLLATWDDHDYGINDGGADFPKRRESQQVQVILLDTRFFRSPLLSGEFQAADGKKLRKNLPNTTPGATILGEPQWKWLEEQLREPADLRILVSSIQVLPEDHRFEKWANFPQERARLLKLIADTRAAGVILVSGDRHMAEISRVSLENGSAATYLLHEITSSGMTHAGGGSAGEPNRHRISETNFRELNFGSIEIKWNETDPLVRLLVLDHLGREVQTHEVRLSTLQPR